MFEFRANATTSSPEFTHQDILNYSPTLSMCPSPHRLFAVFEYTVSKLSSNNLGFALKHKSSSKPLKAEVCDQNYFPFVYPQPAKYKSNSSLSDGEKYYEVMWCSSSS